MIDHISARRPGPRLKCQLPKARGKVVVAAQHGRIDLMWEGGREGGRQVAASVARDRSNKTVDDAAWAEHGEAWHGKACYIISMMVEEEGLTSMMTGRAFRQRYGADPGFVLARALATGGMGCLHRSALLCSALRCGSEGQWQVSSSTLGGGAGQLVHQAFRSSDAAQAQDSALSTSPGGCEEDWMDDTLAGVI